MNISKITKLLREEIHPPVEYSFEQKQMFDIGITSSLLFFEFINFVIKEVKELNIQEVYYVTREGEFFQKIHQEINSVTINHKIQPLLLEMSRLTTFSASLENISITELMRIWRMYSSQSIKSLMISLNLDGHSLIEIQKICDRYLIDINVEIEFPWLDKKVNNLFCDPDFIKTLECSISQKRNLLIDYLCQKGIGKEREKIAIVDIGWRGTTQDNIALLYKKTQIYAFYFGMQNLLNPQPKNIIKKSFIGYQVKNNRLKEALLLTHVSPLEMMCNSSGGSVVNYKLVESKSNVLAIRKSIAWEDFVYETYIRYFQEGVLQSVAYLTNLRNQNPNLFSDSNNSCLDIARKLLTNPPKIMAEAYFELNHDETFGLGKIVKKKVGFPLKLFFLSLFFKKERKQLGDFLSKTGWPQGFFSYYKLSFLNLFYNFRQYYRTK